MVFLWFLCLSMLLNSSDAGTSEWRSLAQIANSPTSRPLLSPPTLSSMKHYGVAASGLASRVRQGDRMCWLTVTEAELMGKRKGQLQQKPREGTLGVQLVLVFNLAFSFPTVELICVSGSVSAHFTKKLHRVKATLCLPCLPRAWHAASAIKCLLNG